MKTQQHRIEALERKRFDADLDATMDALFRRCPTLCGFSVQDAASLARDGLALQNLSELFLTEVTAFPCSGLQAPEELCREIATALVELIDERPEARELLCGRTFARVAH